MADLNVALILRFVDQATRPARAAMGEVGRMAEAGQRVGAAQIAQGRERIALAQESSGRLLGETAALVAQGWAMTQALKPAIAFEAKMAEVGKVIDFDAPDGLKALGRDIQKLVTDGGLPLAADGIAEIVAAAGSANLIDKALPDAEKRAALVAFAEAAGKMGVAFEISAAEAGQAMAVWRASLGLTQDEALSLGDAVNHLSNNIGNASAASLTEVIRRTGAVAKGAGLADQEVAALSAALLSGGSGADVAATALKNFTSALTRGEAATDRQAEVLDKLGFNAVDLAKRMQVDARGAILDVVGALRGLEDFERPAAISMLFGEEVVGSVQPLIENASLLEGAFGLVGDKANYAGAMTKEYEGIAATTESRLIVMASRATELAVILGSVLLPAVIALIEAVTPAVSAFAEFAEAHPGLIRALAALVAGLFAVRVAALAARFGFAQISVVWGVLKVAFGAGMWVFSRAASVLMWLARGALPYLGTALRAAGSAVVWLGRAFMIAGRFLLANPIVAVIAAIAGLAYVIYQNWDGIVAYFQEKIERVRAAFQDGLLDGVLTAIAEFNPYTLLFEGLDALWTYLTTGWDFTWLTDRIRSAFDIDLLGAGKAMIQSLWDGALSIVGPMVASISAKLAAIVPDWLRRAWDWVSGGGKAGAGEATPPGRAIGGAVRAGQVYRWMEEGEEFFVPRVDGAVVSSRELRALRAGGARRDGPSIAMGDIVVNAAPGMSAEDVARAVRREIERMARRRGAELHDGGAYAA